MHNRRRKAMVADEDVDVVVNTTIQNSGAQVDLLNKQGGREREKT
jgi:hypothetical protein